MGHDAQISFAASTPTPSEGKNTEGGWLLQLPWAIQLVSMRDETFVWAEWFPIQQKVEGFSKRRQAKAPRAGVPSDRIASGP